MHRERSVQNIKSKIVDSIHSVGYGLSVCPVGAMVACGRTTDWSEHIGITGNAFTEQFHRIPKYITFALNQIALILRILSPLLEELT